MRDTIPENSPSVQGRFVSFLGRKVPRWKDRTDSEHEQAVIRILVGLLAAAYLWGVLLRQQTLPSSFLPTTLLITLFFAASALIIAWLLWDPGKNAVRRILGCLVDMTATSMAIYLNGNLAAPMFVVYLWVTFGNGFRFGRKYLFFSMAASLLGYSLVLMLTDVWENAPYISLGILAGMIMLPLYVASLLKRLTTALARAEIASQAKSNFLATMSHEIRTPLNGVVGIIDLLGRTPLDSRQQHYMRLLNRSSEWLLRTISDGLDFTKIEAGELIVEEVPASLKEILNSLSEIYGEMAGSTPVAFVAEIDPALPDAVQCDPFRLFQVLNNLLANAFKFTSQGEVRFSVTFAPPSDRRIRVFFRVTDTGKGIGRQDLPDIFKPFHQADLSTSRHFGGTGLGLAIADRIIRIMGGEIQVESSLGKGATFSFALDLTLADRVLPQVQDPAGILWQREPEILLVEDNEINQEVAANLLKHLGCSVSIAGNGTAALAAVAEHTFDLILMDCQMPEMDGYEAAARIRSMPQFADLPIVALTAHTTIEDREKCFAAGMTDYMGKPFRVAELEGLLGRWLSPLITAADIKRNPDLAPIETCSETRTPAARARRSALHDLKNRLSAILGSAELALIEPDDALELQTQMKNILKAVNEATQISARLN